MKLALCLEYPIGQFGGTEIIVQQLLAGLPARFEIVLVSPDTEESLRKSGFAGRVARHIPWDSTRISPVATKELACRIRDAGVELAHFHLGGNYAWGTRIIGQCPVVPLQRLGVPCLTNNNGFFSIFDGYCGAQRSWFIKLGYLPLAWLAKIQELAAVKTEVVVSRNDLLALRRCYFPLRSRFRLIYPSRIRESELHERMPRTKTILCVGTIGPRKGQTHLAEAFCRIAGRHPDWTLTLAGRNGDESMMRRINDLTKQNGLQDRMRHLNQCTDAEVLRLMRTSAIFAMPSIAEGLGMSLMEALYHGCACVGSRVGGIRDLIQDGDNGLFVEPGNVAELAEALDRLIVDEALRGRFAARGPKSVLEKEMTAERMVGKYAALYEQILTANRA